MTKPKPQTELERIIEEEIRLFKFDETAHAQGKCSFSLLALCSAEEQRIQLQLRQSLSRMAHWGFEAGRVEEKSVEKFWNNSVREVLEAENHIFNSAISASRKKAKGVGLKLK